jgi:hypothetical protein
MLICSRTRRNESFLDASTDYGWNGLYGRIWNDGPRHVWRSTPYVYGSIVNDGRIQLITSRLWSPFWRSTWRLWNATPCIYSISKYDRSRIPFSRTIQSGFLIRRKSTIDCLGTFPNWLESRNTLSSTISYSDDQWRSDKRSFTDFLWSLKCAKDIYNRSCIIIWTAIATTTELVRLLTMNDAMNKDSLRMSIIFANIQN